MPAAQGVAALPDEVLLQIFSALELNERHQAVPLVCRRWSQLVNSPQMLHNLSFTIDSAELSTPRGHRSLDNFRSFSTWLLRRAAGHVQQLSLSLCLYDNSVTPELAAPLELEYFMTLSGMLAATGSSLLELQLQIFAGEPAIGSWIEALPNLQRLHIQLEQELTITALLHRLTALQQLHLEGGSLVLGPGARLPPALTALSMQGVESTLAKQVTELTQLRVFNLEAYNFMDNGLAALAHLTSLKLLKLKVADGSFPDSLPLPRSAQALQLSIPPWVSLLVEQANELLQSHTHLTCLDFARVSRLNDVPSALAGLTHLQRFRWNYEGASDTVLPAGAWLGGLGWLVLPASTLAMSQQALAPARKLECLGLLDFEGMDASSQSSVIHWLAQNLPSLKRLSMGFPVGARSRKALTVDTAAACMELQRKRPDLCIDWGKSVHDELWQEL